MTMKCDEIYQSVINNLDTDSKTSLFDLAQCFISGYEPDKLRLMLTSGDDGIVSDGLFVLGEIGDLASNYSTEVEVLTEHADPEIRRLALERRRVLKK